MSTSILPMRIRPHGLSLPSPNSESKCCPLYVKGVSISQEGRYFARFFGSCRGQTDLEQYGLALPPYSFFLLIICELVVWVKDTAATKNGSVVSLPT